MARSYSTGRGLPAPVRASGLLDVGSGQRIYWEESGRPDGVPALYLHGGPGGILGQGGYRSAIDPSVYRVIGLDQRGCGRSTPRRRRPSLGRMGGPACVVVGGCAPAPGWDDPVFRQTFATLTTHYWSHDGFLDPPLLERLDVLDGIPRES
ncbi:MAG TPA: hypothetical protein VFP34_04370 [Microlunatus sp.]|nr:hypothetical protein [Microlunatus sp.]